jgi:nitronate monooxygenase
VQIGTAYLLCPEAKVSPLYRKALKNTSDTQTTLTDIFTGRPARGIMNRAIKELGPISENVPDFPLAATALGPLRS